MARVHERIGGILQRWGLLTAAQAEAAVALAADHGRRVGEILVELGLVQETDVAKALAWQYGLEYVAMDEPDAIVMDNLKYLPVDMIRKYKMLTLSRTRDRMKILVHDPTDHETLDLVRARMKCELEVAVGAKGKIEHYIEEMFQPTVCPGLPA